ncbi:BnaC04g49660D [Brassica napus]|uniref:thioglucosidase n=1 Tax=Brassica napus TaxID=3708 RepID=A0A078GFN2_BRANA|nr:BnaC04g49660D [Brassica napus]
MHLLQFSNCFLFGTASSAYQYEGAVKEGSRGESMWDTFARKYPERNCHSNADETIDFYHRYKEDIQRMKDINMDSFRFSISWVRILPHGKLSKGVNKEGIRFYNELIDELLANGITPLATLFHWDTPQALEEEYGGFLSENITMDFRDFANICFEEFGDRVKLWLTINEPWVYSVGGYDAGRKAPGRASKYMNDAATAGKSGHEAYIVSHNLLLSHAEAVEAFRNCHNCKDGKIGMAHCPLWYEPYDVTCDEDVEAAERAMEFMFGWHMNPTVYGDYPEVMKKIVGKRLPSFTDSQSRKLKGSFDFIGINYYSSVYAKNVDEVDPDKPFWRSDQHVEWKKQNKAGKAIGAQGGVEWNLMYPQGLRKVLNYAKNKYGNPKFIITENGHCDAYEEKKPKLYELMDMKRTDYHKKHISNVHQAIYEDGVQVDGYFAWSLLDNCEWNCGYEIRYGLFYVDYENGLERYPKMSAMWFKEFLKEKDDDKIKKPQVKRMPRRPSGGRRFIKHQPLSFSPFMRSLALASRRKLHHHHQQEDSQRSGELMSFDQKLPTLSKKEQKEQLSDSSDEEDSQGDVQADFEFFDPKPTDFNGVKILLKNYLDDKEWDLSSFVDLVLEQTTVGTVVKVADDEDESVFAVVSALNLARYKEHKCFRELKEFLLQVCSEKSVAKDLEAMLEKKAQGVGVLVSQRVMNLPPQLLPPLYDGLFDEVSWATEDEPTEELRGSFRFKWYLLVTKIYKLKNPKQRKPRRGEEEEEETVFLKPEDELFLQLSSWSFTYPMRSQLVTSHEMKNYQLMGLVMAVEAKRIPEFRQMLNSLID